MAIEGRRITAFGEVFDDTLPLGAVYVPESMYYMQHSIRFHELKINLEMIGRNMPLPHFDCDHSSEWQEGVLGRAVAGANGNCFEVSDTPIQASWWHEKFGYLDRLLSLYSDAKLLHKAGSRQWNYVHSCGTFVHFELDDIPKGFTMRQTKKQ